MCVTKGQAIFLNDIIDRSHGEMLIQLNHHLEWLMVDLIFRATSPRNVAAKGAGAL